MNKCRFSKCNNDVTGRQVYCSDKCRKAQSRTDKSDTSNNSDIRSDTDAVAGFMDEMEIGLDIKPEQLRTEHRPKPIIGELTKERQLSQKGFNE